MATAQYKSVRGGHGMAIIGLIILSSLIVLFGAGFMVYAIINKISFSVMSAQIPASLFAAVVTFLGIRYFISSIKLAKQIKGKQFSWSNFKRADKAKERRQKI
jgi:xanthosine utilization system XapX-like protein